ncbi:YSIRK-type signal peptide-containing protein [Dolosicoccus paucivorans]|nr:YSIRK-type signal peptide-containing protein [Dolosicoccus paucivorans]
MSKRKNGFNPLPEVHNRYSIRRFSVGTASVLIGATLFFWRAA